MTSPKTIGGAPVTARDGMAVEPEGVAATAGNTTAGGAGAAATLTFTATPGLCYKLAGLEWSLSDVPGAEVLVTVADDAATVHQFGVTTAGPGFMPLAPAIIGTANKAMTVTVAAPGGAILARINARPTLVP